MDLKQRCQIFISIWAGFILSDPLNGPLIAKERTFFEMINGSQNRCDGSFLKDRGGSIWAACEAGFFRFDGQSLDNYTPESGLFANAHITDLYEDFNGVLWIGTTEKGVFQFNKNSGNFTVFRNGPQSPNRLDNNHVLSIGQEVDGPLWVETKSGTNRFDHQLQTFVSISPSLLLSNWKILLISCLLLVAMTGIGVLMLAFRSKQRGYKSLIEEKEESHRGQLLEITEKLGVEMQAKRQFLATISHETRTPMNAVLGFSEILNTLESDPQKKEYLKLIRNAGQALMNLLSDVIELSKLERGTSLLEKKPVLLSNFFTEIETVFENTLADKGVLFNISLDEELPKIVNLDVSRFRQILVHLMSNAVKFTDTGQVSIRVYCNYPYHNRFSTIRLFVEIQDSGPGIDPEQIESIFDIFTQIKGEDCTEYGGTGIGLKLCQEMARLMEGKIEVYSEEGIGSTFKLSLDDVEVASIPEWEMSGKPDYSAARFSGGNLLVADDIAYNRDLIKSYLSGFPFKFTEAETGKDVLKLASQDRPQLILMDLHMPEMNGLLACLELKNNEALKSVPIVAMTASSRQLEELKDEMVFDALLTKPLSKAQLLETLMEFLPYSESSTEHLVDDTGPPRVEE